MNVCFRNLQDLGKLKSYTMKYHYVLEFHNPILPCHNLPANHPSDSDPFMSMKSLSHTFQYIVSVKKNGDLPASHVEVPEGHLWYLQHCGTPILSPLKKSNVHPVVIYRLGTCDFPLVKPMVKSHKTYWNTNQIRWHQKIPSAQARSLNGQGTAVGSPRAPPWGLSTSLVGQGDPQFFLNCFLVQNFPEVQWVWKLH